MSFLSDNIIADGLLIAMRWVFSWIQDYSLVIILVTIALKLVLMPLDLMQRRSSMRMQLATADVEGIKKRYANNPDQANKKVQEYYKEHGIKPSAGCLPMLISMVFLFAFYGALRAIVTEQTISMMLQGAFKGASTVELPKLLWINNIYQPDAGHVAIMPTAQNFLTFLNQNSANVSPQMLYMLKQNGLLTYADGLMTMNTQAVSVYTKLTDGIVAANNLIGRNNGWYGLPIIAGGTLFLQQWLTTKTTPSASQQPGGKMMMYFFPLFSAYICITTNSCFALYWTISNVFAMAVHFLYTAYAKSKKKVVTTDDIR